jgi:Raf kinase inhibitor-like YbhB/YbcL family protein
MYTVITPVKYYPNSILQSSIFSWKGEEKMQLHSNDFREGGDIPSKDTCDSSDLSPSLEWSDAPSGTKSFALICDDPDAPVGTWVHWVIYNLPGNINKLGSGIPTNNKLTNGALQGVNDFHRMGYGGPCPPGGSSHRYFFKLYALNTVLALNSGATKSQLLKAMNGHVLEETSLMGKYRRH